MDLSFVDAPSALPFNELRSLAGEPNHPRTSPVVLRPHRRRRAWRLDRLLAVLRDLVAIFVSRADLMIENLALRQQLAVRQRRIPRPRLLVIDRILGRGLRRWWPRGETALAIVQPAVVMCWPRKGSRRYGRRTSRRNAARPSTTANIRALVHGMAAENPSSILWSRRRRPCTAEPGWTSRGGGFRSAELLLPPAGAQGCAVQGDADDRHARGRQQDLRALRLRDGQRQGRHRQGHRVSRAGDRLPA